MSETWRLLDVEFRNNPFMNLAVEEAIPRMVGEGNVPNTVRFWHNSNTIVIGCFQSAKLEVNFEACKRYHTDIVRRFTGGGAVYHDAGNLNYAISLKRGHKLVPQDNLQFAFEKLSEGTVRGLKGMGVNAAFQPINDVHANGLKISGAAGSIRWNTVFHHGCILVASDLSILGEVLNVPQVKLADKHVASVRKRVTTVMDELNRDVSTKEAKESIVEGMEAAYHVELEPGELSTEELDLAEQLYDSKYSREGWNLGR